VVSTMDLVERTNSSELLILNPAASEIKLPEAS
jgi:hypothetical protein